jgi:hypothetical protein
VESFTDRLRRFLAHEDEVPLTLLVWAQNLLLPQLRVAKENRLDNLIFLGTHAFVQAFSEKALGVQGRVASKCFFRWFMDDAMSDRQFSQVSDEIHEMRNVMAHQLFSSRTHIIAIDYTMAEGWRREPALLRINPDVYAEQFITAVDGGRLWEWKNFVTSEQRIVQKYRFVRDWLDLPKKDTISQAVDHLTDLTALQDILGAGIAIDAQIKQRYNL